MIHESTLPYQGGQGGSNLKSIFNLIITSYLTPARNINQSSRYRQTEYYLN
ncbi:unknown protein [Microcystis aeruginosa NIES-843]|uniref:Uncharacterized protein n=1 Tax=Microcystis aeruginosa (strain NIES-843 / IAM M-2473) TaxID=449447 RepID=B0JNC1_MICAN|nr:unknown protein [Microcystis aeruginosa NIES-843]